MGSTTADIYLQLSLKGEIDLDALTSLIGEKYAEGDSKWKWDPNISVSVLEAGLEDEEDSEESDSTASQLIAARVSFPCYQVENATAKAQVEGKMDELSSQLVLALLGGAGGSIRNVKAVGVHMGNNWLAPKDPSPEALRLSRRAFDMGPCG